MDKLLATCGMILSMLGASVVHAELCVIVHPDNPVPALSAAQISDLYLGRARGVDRSGVTNEARATIYEQPETSELRAAFYRSLNAMSIERVTAYWARLRFSGQMSPPESLPDSRAIVSAVSKNPQAIGYVDAGTLAGAKVKVVLRLGE